MYYFPPLFYAFSAFSLIVSSLSLGNLLESPSFIKLSRGLFLLGTTFLIFFLVTSLNRATGYEILTAIARLSLFSGLLCFIFISLQGRTKFVRYGILLATILFVILLVVLRAISSQHPTISSVGVLNFNNSQAVSCMAVLLINASIIPATFTLYHELRKANKTHAARALNTCLIIFSIGLSILIVSNSAAIFLTVGWLILVAEVVITISAMDLFR